MKTCDWYKGSAAEKNKAVYTSRSRVRVGRGSDEIDQLDGLAGAVTPKPPVNAEKSKVLRTDRPTDRRTEWVIESRARD